MSHTCAQKYHNIYIYIVLNTRVLNYHGRFRQDKSARVCVSQSTAHEKNSLRKTKFLAKEPYRLLSCGGSRVQIKEPNFYEAAHYIQHMYTEREKYRTRAPNHRYIENMCTERSLISHTYISNHRYIENMCTEISLFRIHVYLTIVILKTCVPKYHYNARMHRNITISHTCASNHHYIAYMCA